MDLVKKLNKNYFKMLIMGASNSGKSYFLMNTILPLLKKKYDEYCIFTREFNKREYQHTFRTKMRKEPRIYIGKDNILEKIRKIMNAQRENVKKYDKRGIPIYHTNILFIFDDIIDEKLFKEPLFMELFFNMRHMQISTILCAQLTNKAIATQMKGNTDFFVMFRIGDMYQRRFYEEIIGGCLLKCNPELTIPKTKEKARKIISERIMKIQYGYVICDNNSNIY